MQIKVVTTIYQKDFQEEVNRLLNEGWELHGEPNIQTNAQQDTWEGRLRCWTETTYIQVLKKNI